MHMYIVIDAPPDHRTRTVDSPKATTTEHDYDYDGIVSHSTTHNIDENKKEHFLNVGVLFKGNEFL